VLTTLCGMSSRFVHVTAVPAGMLNELGLKAKLSILTSVVLAVFSRLARDVEVIARVESTTANEWLPAT